MWRLTGIPVSPGRVRAPLWTPAAANAQSPASATSARSSGDEGAIARAATAASESLTALAARSRAAGWSDEAEILDAQSLMAVDSTLLAAASRLLAGGLAPAEAISAAAEEAAGRLEALEDSFLSARAADVRDVGARIARILTATETTLPDGPVIAAGRDLPPSLIAELGPERLLGIALEEGSPTAHAAIVARSLGVPMIVGARGLVAAIRDALAAAGLGSALEAELDGTEGAIVFAPAAEMRAIPVHLPARTTSAAASAAVSAAKAHPPLRIGGRDRLRLLANIVPGEEARALAAGAEGIGLLRTEFLFLGRDRPPDEQEQVEAYRRTFEAFAQVGPVVVRLVDVGGDKELPYLGLAREANPFLGVRGIRLGQQRPELLVTQVRAIARAATLTGTAPRILVPMVATLADLELAHRLCDEALESLVRDGLPRPERVLMGAMIEVPAAALIVRRLLPWLDFLSIGTNDLTQYVLAADRGNALLAPLQDGLHPAVLRLIAGVVEGVAETGVELAACGEVAGEPEGALVLAALGLRELSVDPGALGVVRDLLGHVDAGALDRLESAALDASDATEVRAAARALIG